MKRSEKSDPPLCLIVVLYVETQSEEQGEDRVHLARQQPPHEAFGRPFEPFDECAVEREPRPVEVEVLAGVDQDDAGDGDAAECVGDMDACVRESGGSVHGIAGKDMERPGPRLRGRTVGCVPLFADDGLEFLDRDGDLAVAEHSAPLLRHEDVVLDADAAEVAVGLQGVVVHDPPCRDPRRGTCRSAPG